MRVEDIAKNNNQIVILGAGFAGLFTALHLEALGCPLPIMLIDRNHRFVFKPLLYELLSEEVPEEAVWPHYEDLLGDRGITHIQGEVQSIDLQHQQVILDSEVSCGYQYLVIALGDVVGYFDIPGAPEYTLTFRTGEDVLRLRTHLQQQLHQASQLENAEQRQAALTIAMIGAGPCGIELAATLADLVPAWYETLGGNAADIRIVLFQRDADILPGSTNQDQRDLITQAMTERQATVEVRLKAAVETVELGSVTYRQADASHQLKADTIIWTAGSATHPLVAALPMQDVHRDPRGRPYLTSALQLIGFPQVFAGGDCAVDVHQPMPATAQVAYQQGRAIAQNIMALLDNRSPEPVEIRIQGSLMKLGMEASLAEMIGSVAISGQMGHLIRRATYMGLLPTPVRNLKLGTEWITNQLFDQFTGI